MRRHVPSRSRTGRPNVTAHPRRSFPSSILAFTSAAPNVRRSTSIGALSRNDRGFAQTTIRSRSSDATSFRTAEPMATTAKVLASLRARRRNPSTHSRARCVGQRRMQRSACARAVILTARLAVSGRPPRSSRSALACHPHRVQAPQCPRRIRFCAFRSDRQAVRTRRRNRVHGEGALRRPALPDGSCGRPVQSVGKRRLPRSPRNETRNETGPPIRRIPCILHACQLPLRQSQLFRSGRCSHGHANLLVLPSYLTDGSYSAPASSEPWPAKTPPGRTCSAVLVAAVALTRLCG